MPVAPADLICNLLSGFPLKYGSAEQPWSIGEGMLGLDLAALGGQAQCFGADAEERRGFGQVQKLFVDVRR